ncbi:MAG: hypothetical protein KDI64_13400 [Candidatus Accumulibacter sp.]|nr:hypothetical protein [Accumulibacter sp.]
MAIAGGSSAVMTKACIATCCDPCALVATAHTLSSVPTSTDSAAAARCDRLAALCQKKARHNVAGFLIECGSIY